MKSGKLIVISSPSGGGKTTIIHQLIKRDQNLKYSVSATTRSPRMNEINGRDYLFINRETFDRHIKNEEFLEWAKVHGHYYGTLKDQVSNSLEKGCHLVLDIDIQGGLAVKKQMKEALLIFVMPPSLDILEERLKNRGTEDKQTMTERLEAASREIEAADHYDYIVFNETIEQAIADIQMIIHQIK